MQSKRLGVSLKLVVSSAIVISMALLALVIIANSYSSNRASLIESAEIDAQRVAESIDLKIESFTQPISSSLKLLELDPLTSAYNHAKRLERLPVLVRALESNSILSSVYAGYSNGDFFLLRSLKLEQVSQNLEAPANAAYLLQSIQRSPDGELESVIWEFYSQSLALLSTQTKNNIQFDPRSRPWFKKALSSEEPVFTSPYVFFTTREIGVTFATVNKATGTVIGMDASINDLSLLIKSLQPSPLNEMVLVEGTEKAIAFPNPEQIILDDRNGGLRLASVKELQRPALAHLLKERKINSEISAFQVEGQNWYGLKVPVGENHSGLRLIFAVPEDELLAKANSTLSEQLTWSALIMLVLLAAGWALGALIARPLTQLAEEVRHIARFDFQHEISVKTPIKEVRRLSMLVQKMASGIDHFKSISRTLSREEDLDEMLTKVTTDLVEITSAGAGYLYLYDADQEQLQLASESEDEISKTISITESDADEIISKVISSAAKKPGRPFATPLLDRDGELLGVLLLLFDKRDPTGISHFKKFVAEISGSAATGIATRRHVEEQEALLDAIIRLLADAIDAKSPYTSGHCERVPELASILIDAAQAASEGAFSEFSMSDKERREFRIAAWLHDCGKITSPEYVVDKATKLETIYNRIHEVRTRFEVLWRDAEIEYWQKLYDGGEEQQLLSTLENRKQALIEQFEFIANTNIGGEFMSDEAIERLNEIGAQEWVRYFDNRLGLSSDEKLRISDNEPLLPCKERLLDDLNDHIIPWGDRVPPVEKSNPANIWGFDMDPPNQKFNKGELHNLSVRRGTLTAEERFAINDHIVQTIKMLKALPLPKDLQRVPDIAGNHHEKMDGTGYPRKLDGCKMSVPERVMVLADIFEALTAADRPYKEAKKLSEAIKIMAFMVKDRHVDGVLFKLFLDSKAYLLYAQRFLRAEQIDKVDVAGMLELAGLRSSEGESVAAKS
ncbi:HD domain-containing phosphohydrolase [Neptuniibacter sp. PT34_22]|uniref:HD domain-containing phosphohydrolase n=1 Tax=Neptuniibacter sp. PT34_22 TaxID=3398205 RepID=UPI0039F5AD75